MIATGKWLIIALTNNFSKHITDHPNSTSLTAVQLPTRVPDTELRFLGWQDQATSHLRALFDDFCDSSELGMRCVQKTYTEALRGFAELLIMRLQPLNRKPDPEFYLLACRRNGIRPGEAVFLDDIGM